jgi:hypothetical protein
MTTSKSTITFQVTQEEKQQLTTKAENIKMSLSQFVRGRALLDQQRINQMEKENQRLKEENMKIQTLSGLELASTDHKNLLLQFTEDQIRLMTRIWVGFGLKKSEKPLQVNTFDKQLKNRIFWVIKDNLSSIAPIKFPEDDYEEDIEGAFAEYDD